MWEIIHKLPSPLLPSIGYPCSYLNSLSLYTDFHHLPPTQGHHSNQFFYLSPTGSVSVFLTVFPCCVQTFPPNRKERKRNQQKQILISFLPLIANLISLVLFIASFSKEFLIFPSSVVFAFKQKNVRIVKCILDYFSHNITSTPETPFMLTSKNSFPNCQVS